MSVDQATRGWGGWTATILVMIICVAGALASFALALLLLLGASLQADGGGGAEAWAAGGLALGAFAAFASFAGAAMISWSGEIRRAAVSLGVGVLLFGVTLAIVSLWS